MNDIPTTTKEWIEPNKYDISYEEAKALIAELEPKIDNILEKAGVDSLKVLVHLHEKIESVMLKLKARIEKI